MKTSTKLLTRLLLLICIFGNNQLLAQTTNAGFTGHVLSEAGAPLPDATVTVKNESTGFRNTSRTNDKGVFLFKELPLGGPYTVTVSSIGFTEQVKSEFTLNQGDQVPVDFALKDASAQLESVTVVSSSLKSRIKEIGASTAVSSRTISRLPVNGRNFTSLIDPFALKQGR
jgi:hypothetical protein